MKKLATFTLTFFCTAIFWSQYIYASLDDNLLSKNEENPIVIELYTSQSCSSCPPADRILSEISDKPGVITLGFHVTYWDHLQWKDSLSRKFATERQHDYSDKAGGRRVYTPQMIVNGTTQFVGSNKGDLAKAIKDSRPVLPLSIARDRNYININLPNIQNFKGSAHIWLYALQKNYTQTMPSGENKGKTVNYSSAVLYEESLGRWNGIQKITSTPVPKINNIDSLVVLVQQDAHGPIIAAGRLDL